MIEICVVIAIVGLIALLSWADMGRIGRQVKKNTKSAGARALVSAVQENAVLTGRAITIKTEHRELVFFPDGRIDEKRDDQ